MDRRGSSQDGQEADTDRPLLAASSCSLRASVCGVVLALFRASFSPSTSVPHAGHPWKCLHRYAQKRASLTSQDSLIPAKLILKTFQGWTTKLLGPQDLNFPAWFVSFSLGFFCFGLVFIFETGSHVAQSGLELHM